MKKNDPESLNVLHVVTLVRYGVAFLEVDTASNGFDVESGRRFYAGMAERIAADQGRAAVALEMTEAAPALAHFAGVALGWARSVLVLWYVASIDDSGRYLMAEPPTFARKHWRLI